MTKNKIPKEIMSAITDELGGNEAVAIVEKLKSGEATDEELANSVKLKLNLVRKILYKLYDYKIASYRRTRDKVTGWFVYYWKVNPERAPQVITNKKRDQLKTLEEQLEHELSNVFYICTGSDKIRYTFEDATEISFICKNCSSSLTAFDNTKIIDELKQQIKVLKKELSQVVG